MDEQLSRLHQVQLEILKVIDKVCRENDIHYSLYAGTLLGAVRHRGFIPWDDDLDVCMERSEYDRFLQAWDNCACADYLLQNKDTEEGFTQSFSKIRKKHTTYLQESWEADQYHTGIFVDVFPIDRLPEGKLRRAFFTWNCLRYQLYCREFIPAKGTLLQRVVAWCLLTFTPKNRRKALRKTLLARITRDRNKKHNAVAIETAGTVRVPLPAELFDAFTELPFEGSPFMCFSAWDAYLSCKYGKYALLPPESERQWKHHPLILDFEHDYQELAEMGSALI